MRKDLEGQLGLIAQQLKPVPLPPLAENPLVSVLTANYNYARFVGEAIESVQRQTYPNWEMIVCDDGSTDGSSEIIRGYAERDMRIRLIRRGNGGQASALNVAYAASKGQVISLLDADDTFLPGKLSAVVDAFVESPSAGFVGHQLQRVDEVGGSQGTLRLLKRLPSGWLAESLMRNGGILDGLPPCSGVSLRREVSDRIFPLPESLRSCADGMILRLSPFITELVGLQRVLGAYRLHSNNAWNVAKMTPGTISRDLEIDERLWNLQREYLRTIDPGLPHLLAPLGENLQVLLRKYVRGRLEGDKDACRYIRLALANPEFASLPAVWRGFWRFGRWVPDGIFRVLLNFATGQGPAKRWASVLVSRFAQASAGQGAR